MESTVQYLAYAGAAAFDVDCAGLWIGDGDALEVEVDWHCIVICGDVIDA